MTHVIGIYHKDCIDGTAAAAVLLRAYPDSELIPLSHSYTPDDFAPILARVDPQTKVYTVDCTFGARDFLDKGITITAIDHHADKRIVCEALAQSDSRFTFVFDETKSGASLTWDHFFANEPKPRLIELIEDVDLWHWKYGQESRDTSSYLWLFRNNPKGMLELIEGDLEPVREKGSLLSQYADTEIEYQCTLEPLTMRVGAYAIQAHNITTHQSAAGNRLSEFSGAAVGMFTVQGNRVKISFRSKDGQVPSALTLASELGGGGHPNAAGATVSLKQFFEMVTFDS